MDNLIKQVYVNDLNLQDVKLLTRDKAPVILYDDLTTDSDIISLLGPNKRAFLLFPTSNNGPSGHFIALLYDSNTRVFEHMDPYGLDINQELKYSTNAKVQQNILGYIYNKLQQQDIKILYNPYKFQQLTNGINTCGKHCAVRLRFHFLDIHQYAKLMLGQKMSADWLVSILSFLCLFKTGSEEKETVLKFLGIKKS